jgi:hypothetical protein
VFYLDVPYVYNGFKCFSCVFARFQTHFKFSFVFRRMLQLMHLDVSKLDQVLHLPTCLSVVSPWCQAREDIDGPHWRGRPHMLAGGAAGETWAGRRGTRDGG